MGTSTYIAVSFLMLSTRCLPLHLTLPRTISLQRCYGTICLNPVCESEIISAFSEINDSCYRDAHNIQVRPVKHVIGTISIVFTCVLDPCIMTATFLSSRRLAKVTVLYKKEIKMNSGNIDSLGLYQYF